MITALLIAEDMIRIGELGEARTQLAKAYVLAWTTRQRLLIDVALTALHDVRS